MRSISLSGVMLRKFERRIFLPVAFLAIFLSYYAGISLFAHIHIVNGAVIVHSHPFAKTSHDHSDAQVLAFNQAGHFHSVKPDVSWFVFDGCHLLRELQLCYDESCHVPVHVSGIGLRAPPYC